MKTYLILICLFSLSLFTIPLAAQVNLEDGLQVYYPFDGNALDASPNGHDGVVFGAVLTEDRHGISNSAYDFSSGSVHISLGNILNSVFAGIGNTFTISLWIQASRSTMSNNVILGKLSDTGCGENERQFVFRLFDNQNLSFTYYSANTIGNARRVKTLLSLDDTSKWYHVVVMYDGNTNENDGADRVRLFVDCEEQETELETATGVLGNIQEGKAQMGIGNYLNIAGMPCLNTTSFDGKIDDIRIYNRLVNEEELEVLCSPFKTATVASAQEAQAIRVYPNPSAGNITLEGMSGVGNRFLLWDLTGRLIQTGIIEENQLHIATPANGLYHLEIKNAQGQRIGLEKVILKK